MEKLSVHKCNGDWMYCDGKCEGCFKNKTNASDVVEVVRCKDCRFSRFLQRMKSGEIINYCSVTAGPHGEDFYCAYGQRKEQC